MINMNIKLAHGTYENCTLKFTKYQNNQQALVINHDNERLLIASVNLPDYQPPEEHICIKNWSENRGILEALIENKVIESPIYFVASGFVQVAVCKLIGEHHHE